MTQFAIYATLLIVVAAAFILPPLWFGLRSPMEKACLLYTSRCV